MRKRGKKGEILVLFEPLISLKIKVGWTQTTTLY